MVLWVVLVNLDGVYIYIYRERERESTRLDCTSAFSVLGFFFFFNAWTIKSHKFTVQRQKSLFTHCSNTIHAFKNIKNESHSTIHIFKNYFVTVFSIFSRPSWLLVIYYGWYLWAKVECIYIYKISKGGITHKKWL